MQKFVVFAVDISGHTLNAHNISIMVYFFLSEYPLWHYLYLMLKGFKLNNVYYYSIYYSLYSYIFWNKKVLHLSKCHLHFSKNKYTDFTFSVSNICGTVHVSQEITYYHPLIFFCLLLEYTFSLCLCKLYNYASSNYYVSIMIPYPALIYFLISYNPIILM